MMQKILRILIVEDTPERQEILRNLFREHAWVLVHTANRAIRLLSVYDFDLISLDFDLAGDKKGDEVAAFISRSRNSKTKVIVHSMNSQGAAKISEFLPNAIHVPLSRMTKANRIFKRIRQELSEGVDINWAFVFGGTGYHIKQNSNKFFCVRKIIEMVEGTLPKILNSKTQSWRLILPWVYAAFIASFLLSIPLLILVIFPETFARIFQGRVSHRVFQLSFPFGTLNPLRPLTVRTLFFSSIPYLGIGLMLSWSRFRTYSHWRSRCSNISLNLAIAGLFFVIPMLATIWFLAIEGGNIPSGPWGIYEGNHGPWRHVYDLKKLLGFTIFIPICSFVLGLISLILRATKLAGVILTASVLSFLLLMYSHYWLIG